MSISFNYDLTYSGPAFPVAEITIASESGQTTDVQTALIDIGADATPIPLAMLKSIKARRVDTKFARNADGTRYAVRLYSVKVTIGPIQCMELTPLQTRKLLKSFSDGMP